MKSRTILFSLPLLFAFAACDSGGDSKGSKRTSSSKTTAKSGGNSSASSNDSSTESTSTENTSSDNPSSSDQSPGNSSDTSGGTANPSEFSGSWHLGNCMPSNDPSYKSITYEVIINGSSLQKFLKYYSDASCSALTSGTEVQATFVVKGASTALAGAYDIDLSVTMFKVEIGDEAGATSQNTRKMCGKSDWKVGDSINCIQGGTMAEFDIAALKNNRLYLGQTDATKDGRTVEKRPVTLSSIGLMKK